MIFCFGAGCILLLKLSIFFLHDLYCVLGVPASLFCTTMKPVTTHCFCFFFSTGWQFTLKIQPHFSRNWGTWYTRATKNNKRTIMIIIILKVINIIVIQFFKIGLQDYWPTMYVGSYVLVIAHFRALSWNYWGGRYCSSLICASRAENSSEKPWNRK